MIRGLLLKNLEIREGLKKIGKFHFRGEGGLSRGHFPLFNFFLVPNGLKNNRDVC